MIINSDRNKKLYSPSRVVLSGETQDRAAYYTIPATPDEVEMVINADPRLNDGMTRSEWRWFRMENGDLMLGTYPQDELYFAVGDPLDL